MVGSRHPVVQGEPKPPLHSANASPTTHGNDKSQWPHPMGPKSCEQPTLTERRADQTQAQVLEIAQPPVDELRRRGRRAGSPIRALDEGNSKTAQRRIVGGPRAVDSTSNHEQVEPSACQCLEVPLHHLTLRAVAARPAVTISARSQPGRSDIKPSAPASRARRTVVALLQV